MSTNGWQAGDIALCVHGGKRCNTNRELSRYPKSGEVYTVSYVRTNMKFTGGVKTGLYLDESAPSNYNGEKVWPSWRFIKISPDADMKSESYEEIIKKDKKQPENV